MTRTQKKLKIEKQRALKRAPGPLVTKNGELVDAEALRRKELWQTEVKALADMQFANVTQVLEALVDKVLDRLQLSAQSRAETREYLKLLLDTDQDLKDQLCQLFKLKD